MSKLPFIIGNMATSFDGKLAPFDRSRLHISCKEDFALRDQIRTWVDGVLIGGTTLLSDNPTLTVKSEELKSRRMERGLTIQPAGIALCGQRGPSPDNNFFAPKDSRRIILAGSDFNGNYDNCCCEIYRFDTKRPNVSDAMKKLYERGITTILAEGGGTLMYNLLKEGLMGEFYVSVHPIIIGGASSPTMFDGDGFSVNEIRKINIIENYHLSDGGIIYHCTIGNVKPRTSFYNNNFIIKEYVMNAMTEQQILKKVAKIIAEITESDKEINIDDNLVDDIGLVSIGYVELVVELEEAFDIIFPDNLLTDNSLITIRDVVDNVKAML